MPLRGAGPLTVFVPTNKAVDRFRDGSVLYMLTDVSASCIFIFSLNYEALNASGFSGSSGRIFLGEQGAPLEVKDIIASNGIIHLIDGILIPPSIVPILPHRCDLHESTIIQVSFKSWILVRILHRVQNKLFSNWHTATHYCCKGFYGPDCKPCLGGFKHPCYDKGTCVDGIQGNGTCQCSHGFEGIACHICSDPKKHGDNCDEECRCVHGVCDNRPGSMGVCRRGSCLKGYTGDLCDKMATPCNSDGVFEHCHINAYCSYSGTNTICVCKPGYEGDGHSCTPINLCLKPSRGGCDSNAHCVSAGPGTVSCVCNEGWTGDGMACIEMNNCLLESRGGCHTNAECLSIGPGQIECICKKGFMGDGKVCDLVNPCLTNNGGCHDLVCEISKKLYLCCHHDPLTLLFVIHVLKPCLCQQDEDTFKYHVIPNEQIFPNDLSDGMLKSTLLGTSYHIMFHMNSDHQVLYLQCTFTLLAPMITAQGVLIKHFIHSISNIKSLLSKAVTSDLQDHSCCPGYYGHECFKCPGKTDNWCSNNGKCQDGVLGNGECLCNEGFHGTACETCQPGRYGRDCKSECHCVQGNGRCLDGIDGNGKCICYKGWKGVNCSAEAGGTSVCSCVAGYRGNGTYCKGKINLCENNNGGCSINAKCTKISPGERTCTCHQGYAGDGVYCLGKCEIILRSIEPWKNTSHITHLLRYHIVGCEELLLSDLKSIDRVVATSGHVLKFSVKEGVLYINDDAKIVASDQLAANGVIHYIDKILIPYDMKKKTSVPQSLNATAAANAYGYTKFSQLLQDTNLMTLVENSLFQPFTMFWPTDAAFNQLPEERKTWLYSPDHQDKLQAYLKAHMIRDFSVVAVNLPSSLFLRTMYGTSLSFNCDKNEIGGILIDNNNAKIIERHLRFDVGIAYGIDQFLEPPNLGARCDGFQQRTISGTTSECFMSPYILRYSPYSNYHNPFRSLSVYNRLKMGCSRQCNKTEWTFQCCKNHYGGSCQVCHGGLEAPCGLHGDCDDGTAGTGLCRCHNGFKGSACELCMRNHYGANCTACNCTVNGQCDDGIDGSGSCFCSEGWTGGLCETKLGNGSKPVCFPVCHSNAVCLPDNQCECQPPYVGEGVNCTAPDFCSESNGGCHQHADCTQAGINVTCTCQQGHSGDGTDCSPIDRCMMEQNGGCSDFASCIFKGPNERDCQCLPEYVGDGIQCLQKVVPPVDRCLDNNGGCDAQATCKDLHFHTNTAGVFHLRPPAGRYKMNFTTAEAACQAEGATLATFSQMSDAQQLGMHLCVAGWMDEKKVGYPIRFPSVKCGDNRVGIILYKEPVDLSTTYDAYCYRMRGINTTLFMYICFTFIPAPDVMYVSFLPLMQNSQNFTNSSFATLFVPHNDGFLSNETLSWRDMEYHISTNNSVHFFENMTHNFIIQSRLGYNLTILVPPISNSQRDTSKPHKLINKRKILDWNIPATNGILHIIEGPLKAPPQIVILGFIILLGGGIAYYLFKHKNDAFRFQYFKVNAHY
uniref:Stabilin 1 n=1 Tax=Denticeps clupeoides TaxID=299321 RepID=A0AAY4C330_9TELE